MKIKELFENFMSDDLSEKESLKLYRRLKLMFKMDPQKAEEYLERINYTRKAENKLPIKKDHIMSKYGVHQIDRLNDKSIAFEHTKNKAKENTRTKEEELERDISLAAVKVGDTVIYHHTNHTNKDRGTVLKVYEKDGHKLYLLKDLKDNGMYTVQEENIIKLDDDNEYK